MKTLFKYIIPILVLPLAFYAYKFYQNYQYEKEIDQSWRESVAPIKKQYYEALEYSRKVKESIKKEKQMLAQDHYGGKTPEETLAMFVEALKKKDAKLAAKYCLPWNYNYCEEYIQEWITKYSDGLNKFLRIYKTGIIKRDESYFNGLSLDIYESKQDIYPYVIKMMQNKETGVWKIEEF